MTLRHATTHDKAVKLLLDTIKVPGTFALEQMLWDQGHADREDLGRLLQALTDRGLSRNDKIFVVAKQCLFAKLEGMEEFRAIAQFARTFPDAVSSSELNCLRVKFRGFAPEYAEGWDDDPDWLRQVASNLEFVGERLQVDVTSLCGELCEKADEIESERAKMQPSEDHEAEWEPSSPYGDDVDGMFQSLREELEGG